MPVAQVISDIHFESHTDKGEGFFLNHFESQGAELLILAGDIVEYWGIHKYLLEFSKHYSDVIYVLGNHEYYGSSFEEMKEIISSSKIPSNVRVLHRESCKIQNQTFIGTTLWFKNAPQTMAHKSRLNDFRYIKKYETWVFEENRKDISFLQKNIDENTIVITHHLPTSKAVPNRFLQSPLTGFFLCDMEPYHLHPKMWIFGHTHWHVDFTDKHGTRFLANPLGNIQDSGFLQKCFFEF
jgi:predicted MPP superfamily phosphohydrolase